jgi:hypothetical protein
MIYSKGIDIGTFGDITSRLILFEDNNTFRYLHKETRARTSFFRPTTFQVPRESQSYRYEIMEVYVPGSRSQDSWTGYCFSYQAARATGIRSFDMGQKRREVFVAWTLAAQVAFGARGT